MNNLAAIKSQNFSKEAFESAAGFKIESLAAFISGMPVIILLLLITLSFVIALIGVSIYGLSVRVIFGSVFVGALVLVILSIIIN